MTRFRLLIASAVAVPVLVQPASATLVVSARVWNGSTWAAGIGTDGNFIPRIQFGVFLSFTDEGADLRACRYNLLGAESRHLDVTDRTIDISSAGLGRQAPYNIGANPLATFFSPSGFRIDEASDAANSPDRGILNTQPLPPVDASHLILLYRFDFIPSPSLTGVVVTVTPAEVVAAFDLVGGGLSQGLTPNTIESATVVFVPAPATFVVCVSAALIGIRRRRVQ